MSDFIKAERVVSLALGLLERENVLGSLVWRDAAGDFAGAKDDTISVRLPAYWNASTRALRSGAARTKSTLHERKIDTTLDTDIYGDLPFSDEQLTLDIADFGSQVISPVLNGVTRMIEDRLVTAVSTADYATTLAFDPEDESADFFKVLLQAREKLNLANVPAEGRRVIVGSAVETAVLASDRLSRVDSSGSDSALRDATIGRLAGFDIVSVPSLPPNEAYAFHRTAYILNSRAPIVPAGAPWGASMSHQGYAVRAVRVFDPSEVEDRFIVDAWMGTSVVTDHGRFDSNGRFVPSVDPNSPGTGESDMFVRAVKIAPASEPDPSS